MIRQGSNEPLRFKLRNKKVLPKAKQISFVVMDSGGIIYQWDENSVIISTNYDAISAPITQRQTLNLEPGPVKVCCKVRDSDNNIIFAREIWDVVVKGDPTYLGVELNG